MLAVVFLPPAERSKDSVLRSKRFAGFELGGYCWAFEFHSWPLRSGLCFIQQHYKNMCSRSFDRRRARIVLVLCYFMLSRLTLATLTR